MSPLVTVVTLTYNSRRYVSDAISSVLGQDFEDFELLISDDCSTDDTLEIVRAFSDERVRTTTTNQNLGPAGNYAHAFRRARGKYIAILNSDDLLLGGSLTRKISILEKDSTIGVVHSNALFIDGAGQASADSYFRSSVPDHRQERSKNFRRYLRSPNRVCFPTVVLRRSLLESAGGIDTSLPHTHDWELIMRLAFWADFFYLSQPLLAYRRHSDNHSSQFSLWSRAREEVRAKAAVVRRLSPYCEFPVALLAPAVAASFAKRTRRYAAERFGMARPPLDP